MMTPLVQCSCVDSPFIEHENLFSVFTLTLRAKDISGNEVF